MNGHNKETWVKRLRLPSIMRRQQFSAPSLASEILEYSCSFDKAVSFTRSCGYDACDMRLDNRVLLPASGNFVEPAFRRAGVVDLRAAAGQCIKWCHYLEPYIEQELGLKVRVTIGQLWHRSRHVFNPSFEDVRQWSRQGLHHSDFSDGNGINLHAWLTVETGEIIEPTFLSTLAAFAHESYRPMAGQVVWGRDPGVLNDHRYVPLAVGREIVSAIAHESSVPLLATNSHDLHAVGAVIDFS